MTEEDFREAEAAAAAMELKLTALGEEEKRAASSEERAASSEERAASSSTASASSSSTSDVAKIPRADDERRRLASEAVSGARASSREVGGRDFAGPGPGGSLREPGRSVAIVTTAALPWMTGTAVNPLLRAAYLARRGLHDVTLVIPWLVPAEQKLIHPSVIFETPEEQGAYVRRWVKERCGFEPAMKLDFYPGRYATDKYSIIPVGDVSEYITDEKRDVAVLEEPEHLNWYHSGSRWSDTFDHVVGVVHTNYLEYARLEKHGEMKEKAMRLVNGLGQPRALPQNHQTLRRRAGVPEVGDGERARSVPRVLGSRAAESNRRRAGERRGTRPGRRRRAGDGSNGQKRPRVAERARSAAKSLVARRTARRGPPPRSGRRRPRRFTRRTRCLTRDATSSGRWCGGRVSTNCCGAWTSTTPPRTG